MNDLSKEQKLTYTEAGEQCGVSNVSVARWVRDGVQGVKLEHFRVGGFYFTTVEAVGRFNAALEKKEAKNA